MVNQAIPEELRDYSKPLSSNEFEAILGEVARKHPEKYREVSHTLLQLGRHAAFEEGATLSIEDMESPIRGLRDQVVTKLLKGVRDLKKAKVPDEERKKAITSLLLQAQSQLVDANYKAMLDNNNPFALQVLSKARGNPSQLAALTLTPGVYTDAEDNIIPLFIQRSYAEGLKPHEFWASTYGARKSTISSKFATREGGYLGKQFNQAALRTVVTGEDCDTLDGIPTPVSDKDNIGSVLSSSAGNFPAGTVISKEVLSDLRDKGIDEILVRSPLTCRYGHGVCQQCVGIRDGGKFPKLGDYVGLSATTALAERIAQGALNCLAEGTEVRMADMSIKKIEDIVPGDLVLGADKAGNAFPTRVTAVWDQGVQPVSRYTYSLGSTKRRLNIECTEAHPILVTKKTSGLSYKKHENDNYWSPLSFTPQVLVAGVKGDDIGAVMPHSITSLETKAEPLAALCGVLFGDGIRWGSDKFFSTSPRFSCADYKLITDLNSLLHTYGYRAKKVKRSYDYVIVANSKRTWVDYDTQTGRYIKTATKHLIKRKLLEWGLANCYAHSKVFPNDVLTWSKPSVIKLIAGYLAADGSVGISCDGHPFISFGSTAKALLETLQVLLEFRLGIYCGSITKTKSAGQGNCVHDMYALYITRTDQIRKFFELVGYEIPGCKRDKLSALIAKLEGYRSAASESFVRANRKSICKLGLYPCWDITVEHADSLFVLANGLIVSNTKHSGGMAKGESEQVAAGFDVIERLFQLPKAFPERASIATIDGKIEGIEEAPQGGWYINIGEAKHFVLPENKPSVKVGDSVYAGDLLSTGLPNPRDIVQYKGLGEGRRYFTDQMSKVFRASGYQMNRRNMELLTRGLFDHVRITNPAGYAGHLPDDIVSYNAFAFQYKPRATSKSVPVTAAENKYLEQPVLHYSIGTRVTPEVMKRLAKFNRPSVIVNDDPPEFEPELVGLRSVSKHEQDWMGQLSASNLKTNLLQQVHRGGESSTKGIHPVPWIVRGGLPASVKDMNEEERRRMSAQR